MAKITVEANQCDVCGYVWLPSGKIAVQCAKCRTRKWNHLAPPKKEPDELRIEYWRPVALPSVAERTIEYEE